MFFVRSLETSVSKYICCEFLKEKNKVGNEQLIEKLRKTNIYSVSIILLYFILNLFA